MCDRAPHRDAYPNRAHVGDTDAQTGRLDEKRIIGGNAMRHEMLAVCPVAGIFNSLKFFDRRLFDLPDHAPEGNIAMETDTTLDDRLDRNESGGQAALHVVGAETPHPAILANSLGSE